MTEGSKIQLIQAACDKDGFAMTLYGVSLVNTNIEQDVNRGINLINFASDGKNVMWAKNIMLYLRGFSLCELPIHHHALLDSDAQKQLDIYSNEEGNMWAMVILGDLYYHGKVTVQDREEAAILLNRAADKGCLLAKELIQEYGIQRQNSISDVSDLLCRLKDKNSSRYWLK